MCDARFYWIDRNTGAIGNTIYHCDIPPEKGDGFIDEKMLGIFPLLGIKLKE